MTENTKYDSTPSMFRNRPFYFTLYVIAVIVGGYGLIEVMFLSPPETQWPILSIMLVSLGAMGLFILAIWWLRVINTRLTVTNERVRFRSGILSKNIREVFLSDIRSVEIDQSFMQRILSTGTVEISSAASSDSEIVINGIPRPYDVKDIIDEERRQQKK